MQLFYRKMECAQLIILLYYWQNQNQDVEAYVLKTVYEHIYTMNIQLMKEYWNRTWRSGTLTKRKVLPDA